MGQKTDSLTGLWNYDKFLEDMTECLRQSGGYLMVLGIDNFKSINVKNGRTFGEKLLFVIMDVILDWMVTRFVERFLFII